MTKKRDNFKLELKKLFVGNKPDHMVDSNYMDWLDENINDFLFCHNVLMSGDLKSDPIVLEGMLGREITDVQNAAYKIAIKSKKDVDFSINKIKFNIKHEK